MTYAEITHPLDNVIAQFASLNRAPPDLPSSIGQPTDSGWYLVSDLLADGKVLDEVLKRFGVYLKTDSTFLQAALLMHPYINPVVSVAVHGLYIAGTCPSAHARPRINLTTPGWQTSSTVYATRGLLPEVPASRHGQVWVLRAPTHPRATGVAAIFS